jgi:hypothetical protein
MSSQRPIIGFTAELERQAWDDEGSEKDRQKALTGASEGDGLALGGLEGLSSAGVSATANLQGVTSRFDWYLDRSVHLEGSGTLTVNDDVVRATSDLDSDCFMRHLQGCCHLRSPLSVGRATAPSSSPERVSAHRLDPVVRIAETRPVGRTRCSMTVRGVSREAAIADYGVVLTGEPDEDLVSFDAAATDAARATRPALAEVCLDRGPGYARRCGGVSPADVDAVGS